ncbi:putative cyclin-dependent serine/threonine-protein kinase DDB_G0272797/DDB_G0274007 isoform X2 [Penaeus chinensis]|uniref:putative cyclin-dependent serine/threonine-protein kinase DDB_G0272797/DDB_G0274007 isoform X2 n=1 Tax=Penaeus chinensis TaxID=139456 RepID=UPI001FB65602|nr:putative cyclin-dependent serine/threonine-protein kinase DDB_G0272797/DDB_G0274007 isoform X2 [Penaeus chinensis]
MAAARSEASGKLPALTRKLRYTGLFTSQMAPTSRAYCILLSFFVGVLMLTAGSVFYHVILIRPMSGSHPMHTPPLPLACGLILAGAATVLGSFFVAWRYGFDDGDDSLEDDLYSLAKDDVLEQTHEQQQQQWQQRQQCQQNQQHQQCQQTQQCLQHQQSQHQQCQQHQKNQHQQCQQHHKSQQHQHQQHQQCQPHHQSQHQQQYCEQHPRQKDDQKQSSQQQQKTEKQRTQQEMTQQERTRQEMTQQERTQQQKNFHHFQQHYHHHECCQSAAKIPSV